MSHNKPIGIISVGHFLPETVIDNDHFVQIGLDTSPEWIKSRTGITSRRISDQSHSTSDLATFAAQNTLKNASIRADQLDFIIVATASPDHAGFPSTACLVQEKLGISKPVECFDISAACSGFAYAISIAYSKVISGMGTYGMVIGAEQLSSLMDWSDRKTAILFGDGAGAAIIGPVSSGGFTAFNQGADGTAATILRCKQDAPSVDFNGQHISNHRPLIHMDGPAVFKKGVSVVVTSLKKLFEDADISPSSVDYFVCHQANIRILESVAKQLKIPFKKFLTNINTVGNTSAASIPLLLSESNNANLFQPGDRVCLVGFGAGFTWSSILLEWS